MRLFYTLLFLQISALFTEIQTCCGSEETTTRRPRPRERTAPPPQINPSEKTNPPPAPRPPKKQGRVNFILYNSGIKYKQQDNSFNKDKSLKGKFNCLFFVASNNKCYGLGLPEPVPDKSKTESSEKKSPVKPKKPDKCNRRAKKQSKYCRRMIGSMWSLYYKSPTKLPPN